jgi:hypothetical protein
MIGYRNTDGLDEQVWNLWTLARLPGRQFTLYRKALSLGSAYAIVGVDPRNPRIPRVTIEGPETVTVEVDPGDPLTRLAALRLWHDGLRKRFFATVYVPGWRYHFRSIAEYKTSFTVTDEQRLGFSPEKWEQWTDPTRSGAGSIPVVPYVNGDEGEEPSAEFAGAGIDIQDRLNLTVLNRLTAERFGAFRQKALTNYVPEEDPVTGLPVSPFNLGADQILTVPPPEPGEAEPKLFDLAQTDTGNMIRGTEQDMRAFAATTRTPVYYLPGGDMVNLSADAIAALDAGHISKIKQRMSNWSASHQETLQLMCEVAQLDKTITAGEIAWSRPENFHWAVVGDYVVKMKSAGVPLSIIMEEIGWSPARVEQLRSEMAAEQLLAAVTAQPPQTRAQAQTTNGATGAGAAPAGAARGTNGAGGSSGTRGRPGNGTTARASARGSGANGAA